MQHSSGYQSGAGHQSPRTRLEVASARAGVAWQFNPTTKHYYAQVEGLTWVEVFRRLMDESSCER